MVDLLVIIAITISGGNLKYVNMTGNQVNMAEFICTFCLRLPYVGVKQKVHENIFKNYHKFFT